MSAFLARLPNLHLGDQISFATRWAPELTRAGTVTRLGHDIVWVGCHCFHANDLRGLIVTKAAKK